MGYRSDVKCITTKKGFELIDKLVRKASGVTDEDSEYWLTDEFSREELMQGKYMLLQYEDIKWYSNDTAVCAFEEALERLDARDIPYQFVRVGEDYTDIEWRENSHYNIPSDMPRLELKREIEVEY